VTDLANRNRSQAKFSLFATNARKTFSGVIGRSRIRTPTASWIALAIAGATGYAGQELVRILARHPAVTLTTAMSSGASSGAARPLPALARIWDGEVVPLDVDRLVADADIIFLALPEAASAELAPRLVERGRRVLLAAFGVGTLSLSTTRIHGVHLIAPKYSADNRISSSVIAFASSIIVTVFGLRGSADRRRPFRKS